MTTTPHTSPLHTTDSPTTRPGHWFGWAVFLGMSWTWCIGMFLPHLLIRDYGILGWIVFAMPNVLGAAVMGWTIRSVGASQTLIDLHRPACVVFSIVTIAFHVFFTVAVIAPLARSLELAVGGVLVGGILFYIVMTRGFARADLVLAAVVLVVSLAMMGVTIQQLPYSTSNLPYRLVNAREPLEDLVSLAPVCIFGFLFCPYLDLTFHRARQQTDRPRAAFGVGFGVIFLSMIVFSILYSDVFGIVVPSLLGLALFIHMAAQGAFTAAAHARELRHHGLLPPIAVIAISATAIAAHWLLEKQHLPIGLGPGELIYRIFMGFYGLVAPAYVWLVVAVGRQLEPGAGRRNLRVFAIAVLLAAPCFWQGFVARDMFWLAPGILIVLAARWFVRTPVYAKARGL